MKNKFTKVIENATRAKLFEGERPFFLYDLMEIEQNIKLTMNFLEKAKLKTNKSNFYFSYKSCPNSVITQEVLKSFNGVDVSSLNEYLDVKRIGILPSMISVSGPAKTTDFFKVLIDDNVSLIHFDSEDEVIEYVKILGQSKSKVLTNYSCRLSVDKNSNKLGMSVSEIKKILSAKLLPIKGIHAYLGREKFSNEGVKELATQVNELKVDYNDLENVFLGPGLSSEILKTDPEAIAEFYPNLIWHFEMGRVIVDSAGFYFGKILSVKKEESLSLIINGGAQHYLSAFTDIKKINSYCSLVLSHEGEIVEGNLEASVYGSLCLSNDLFAWLDNCPVTVRRGWWTCFYPCGAYNISASLNGFINQDKAKSFLLNDQELQLI